MKILVYGCGVIGSYLVHKLCEAGNDVKLIEAAGIPVRPKGDEVFFDSAVKTGAVRSLLYLIAKTSLGKLCATDHCRNAVTEMEWLDEQFEQLRMKVPEHPMPVWTGMREKMPAWEQIHQTYDRPKGTLPPMKPEYANWIPKDMVLGTAVGTGALLTAGVSAAKKAAKRDSRLGKLCSAGLLAGATGLGAFTIYSVFARKAFSYDGQRKLSKQIVEGTAAYVNIPDGGIGLDVGCGSGALTIACAKRNPNATMVGMDHWSLEYRDFSKAVCERNAAVREKVNPFTEEKVCT